MKECSAEGCDKPHSSRGLCKTHYNRAYYLKNAEEAKAKAQTYRDANRDAYREAARRHYQENAEAIREWHRNYRKANPEKLRASDRERYPTRAEAVREYMREYRQQNPGKIRAHNQRRLALKRGATGTVEKIVHQEIAERDGWRCHICGKRVKRKEWSLDHLVPLSAGGEHTRMNVALAHRRCNSQRHTGCIPAQLLLLG